MHLACRPAQPAAERADLCAREKIPKHDLDTQKQVDVTYFQKVSPPVHARPRVSPACAGWEGTCRVPGPLDPGGGGFGFRSAGAGG